MGDFSPIPGSRAGAFVRFYSAVGNTTAGTSTMQAGRSLIMSGAGIASVGFSGAGGTSTIVISATSATSRGMSAIGNTTVASSMSNLLTALTISGAGGVSVGYSSSTLVISGGAGGGNNLYLWEPVALNTAGTSTLSMSTSTGGSRNNYIMGYDLQNPLVFDLIRMIGSFTIGGITQASSSKSTTGSGSAGCTLSVVLYSNLTAGGQTGSMTSFTSTVLAYSVSGSLSASSSVYSQSMTVTWVTAGLGTTSASFTGSTTTTGASYNQIPGGTSSFSGFRPIDINIGGTVTLQPANYAVNIAASHVVAGGMSFSPALVGIVNTITVLGMGALTTNATFYPNLGIQSNNSTMVPTFQNYGPSTMSSNFRAYVQFISI